MRSKDRQHMVIRFAKAGNPARFVDMRLKDRQHMMKRFAKARFPASLKT